MKQFTSNLECYLEILEQASEICGSEYKPRVRYAAYFLIKLFGEYHITWEVIYVCQFVFYSYVFPLICFKLVN